MTTMGEADARRRDRRGRPDVGMPLWQPYDEIAEKRPRRPRQFLGLANAWASTAALFLKRFVPDGVPWSHLDTYAWRDAAKPGRPKGGEALGLRATFAALKALHPRR